MNQDSLVKFIESIRKVWGPVDSPRIEKCQSLLEELARAPASESWLAALQSDSHESHELYRDPAHGFVLLAHFENEGLYRAPHDHGIGWVIYAVQRGEMEMGTYGRVQGQDGEVRIVRRELYRVAEGQSRVYLPGDIHHTRCVSSSVLMLRLTSCDLKEEIRLGRMHRYS